MAGIKLHIDEGITVRGFIVLKRFLRGAPRLGSLLFADIGLLGLIAMLDPIEQRDDETTD